MSGVTKGKDDPESKGMLRNGPGAQDRPQNDPKTKGMLGNDQDDPEDNLRSNQLPVVEETACGIWFIRGSFLQKFANKKAFVFLNGIMGLIMGASYVYFGGTITTIEKRFKLNSKTTGKKNSRKFLQYCLSHI